MSREDRVALWIVALLVFGGPWISTRSTLRFASAAGGNRGAEVFHSSKPSCQACHNPRKGSLADYGLRGSRPAAERAIRKGIEGKMPSYKMSNADLDALVTYLMSLKGK